MYGDIERVADKGTLLLLRGGGGGRVVEDGEREEVGAIAVLTAGGDAEPFARCGDVREGDPGGSVGGLGEVEGITMGLAFSRKKELQKWRGAFVVTYRAFHGLGAKGRIGGPEAMS